MNAFRSAGVRAVGVDIKWQRSIMSRYVEELVIRVRSDKNRNYYILGHSYGAMAALIAASHHLRPRRLFLCSLSPYFSDFISKDKAAMERELGKRRARDFANIHFRMIIRNIRARTELFVGDNESASVVKIARRTHRSVPGARLVVVKNAAHKLDNENYLAAVIKRIYTIEK
jgi:pimeloyl-ACP methyl ester carboxylesterase